MITFCPLASGSKGNCLFLGTPKVNILIDAGISAKAISAHLEKLGSSIDSIAAIIITHEHSDHISGLKRLAFKYQIPIIANYQTAESIVESLGECPRFYIFTTDEEFEFCGLKISPFTIPHDGVDPIGLTIETNGTKIGICTDAGFITPSLIHNLKECDVLCIEANHQPELVLASSRPEIYKRRVLSKTGHLSNIEAARLLKEVAHPNLQHVYLAHLSEESNTPETALNVVSEFLERAALFIPISIAHQQKRSFPYQKTHATKNPAPA